MRNTFSVLFYLKRNAPARDGSTPVMGRITINGRIAQFSTHLRVDPGRWDTKRSRMKGRDEKAAGINERLETIRSSIGRCYYSALEREGYVSARRIRNAYLGLDACQEGLLQLFAQHNAEFRSRVGQGRSRSTYIKYRCVYSHLCTFVRRKRQCRDIPLRELDSGFIRDFDLYLRRDRACCVNTVWVYMMPLRKMISIARSRGLLASDPFAGYKITPQSRDRGFLTLEEIGRLMGLPLERPHLALARDVFVFSCFTGLSYTDVKRLTPQQVRTSFDGHLWVMTRRQKTNIASDVRLLDIPRTILLRYLGGPQNAPLFPLPSNAQCNVNLKKIAAMAGIETHTTFHLARHTFATTVTLSHGVPIETVSRMLGHASIKTTQIYARITHQKISRDMERLSDLLQDTGGLLPPERAAVRDSGQK